MTDEAIGEAPEAEVNTLAANEDAQTPDPSTEQQNNEQGEPAEGEADPQKGEGQKAEEPKVPDGVQQRINEITRKRREAERRAEKAERKLKEFEGRDLDGLDYEDQIAERTLNRSRKEQYDSDRETAQELAQEAYQARASVAASKYPDYAEVTGNPTLQITPAMAEAIVDSEHGPEVAYHLGKNPAEAARIARLNPPAQIRAIGNIEAAVTAPKQATTPPPPPVKAVGAQSKSGAKDPTKMTMAEYIEWRAKN
jgi:hypothetical protein